MKKVLLSLSTLCFLFLVSCKTDKGMVDAIVIDTKDVTHLGCGYVLQLMDSALLQPINLPSAYHHDGLRVKVDYEHTGVKDTCQYGTVIYDLVNVKKIKNALK